MDRDRIILCENIDRKEALKLIKTLPSKTANKNRHKFVFTENKEFVIGRADIENPRHKDLGDPKKDKIAGYVSFTINKNNEVIYVYLNNQSNDFDHPPFENLKEPQLFITRLFGPVSIDMEESPKPSKKIINLSKTAIH